MDSLSVCNTECLTRPCLSLNVDPIIMAVVRSPAKSGTLSFCHVDNMPCMSLPFQCGDRLYTSESDVCRRQILMYKDGPRTERIQILIMAVDA